MLTMNRFDFPFVNQESFFKHYNALKYSKIILKKTTVLLSTECCLSGLFGCDQNETEA